MIQFPSSHPRSTSSRVLETRAECLLETEQIENSDPEIEIQSEFVAPQRKWPWIGLLLISATCCGAAASAAFIPNHGFEERTTALVEASGVIANNFRCAQKHCIWQNYSSQICLKGPAGFSSVESCMKELLKSHKIITGCWYEKERSCCGLSDGSCNIFSSQPETWNNLYMGTMGDETSVCTVLVSKVIGTWQFVKCVSGQTETYNLTVGTNKSEAWSIVDEFPAAASAVAVQAGVLSASSVHIYSDTGYLDVSMEPADGGQVCLWQWTLDVHGPPGLGSIVAKTDEVVLIPAANDGNEPRCIPGHFVSADKTYQTCDDKKYEI